MDSKELTVIIVTFKSEEKIKNCLKSISHETPIIVVENSDNGNFKKKIESDYDNVRCILTGKNYGYAKANNIGLNLVKTKYALVLNPDTTLEMGAIKNFLNTTKLKKDFWLMGPASGQMINLDFKDSDLKEVDNIKGFAIFFNMLKFNKEYFDENYFLFFEEIDLCKKVKKNKGKIYLNRKIIINHEGASSVSKRNEFKLEKNRNWHWMWSTFYYQKKYKGLILALIIISPKFFSSLIKTLFYLLILNHEKKDIYYCRLSGIFNSILGKKSWYRPSLD